jgi:uncharacterized membrane protein
MTLRCFVTRDCQSVPRLDRNTITHLLVMNLDLSCYSFSTSVLDGGEWSASRPGRALPSGKGPPVPIVQEAGWAPEPFWTQRLEEKSFRLCRGSNLDRPVIQPVARHYTDWATRLTLQKKTKYLNTNGTFTTAWLRLPSRLKTEINVFGMASSPIATGLS